MRLPSPGVLGATPRGPTPNVVSLPLANASGAPQVSTSVTCVSSQKPVTTSAVTSAGSTASTSTPKVDKVISLSGSTAFAVKTVSPAVKGAPEFLGKTGTHTVRIVPASPGTLGTKIAPTSGSFTLLQTPPTKTSVTFGPGKVIVSPVSNKPPLVLVVEKPPALAAMGELAADSSVSKPSPVPGLDKPTAVLLVDNSKTVSVQDKSTTTSGHSAVLVLDKPSAALAKTSEAQMFSDNAPKVLVVSDKNKTPTSTIPKTTVLSCINPVDVPLQDKDSNSAIPGSDNLSEGPSLDKSHVVPASGKSATASVQSKQDSSVTDTTAKDSVDVPIDLSIDCRYSSKSDLTSPLKKVNQPTNPSGDGKTSSAEASKANSDLSKPLAFRSNHAQAQKITPDVLFKEMLDLTPLNTSVDGVETIHLESDDHEDDDCVVVAEKKPVMEEGEIGSDVEILGDAMVLTDDSDDDSDSNESICVISVRFSTVLPKMYLLISLYSIEVMFCSLSNSILLSNVVCSSHGNTLSISNNVKE